MTPEPPARPPLRPTPAALFLGLALAVAFVGSLVWG
jgi:hypothetical protein